MATITVKEILQKNRLPTKLSHNPVLTKKLATELSARGYRPTTVRVDGKNARAWTNDPGEPILDVKALLDKALEE